MRVYEKMVPDYSGSAAARGVWCGNAGRGTPAGSGFYGDGSGKVPEELRNVLEEKKSKSFKVTYEDEGYLYICVGYGEQKTSGYSISVKDLYLTKNAIYVDTELVGPGSQEQTAEAVTCPYIVLKLEYLDKSVVFE